ncbi:hypothetical protein LCGC14_0922660 [marine sediment metagenome]|uniref:Calcineurin-like phosphoesterase domain-containing protein n=1 Tax=marine sediment metagenome TaxID=412755 RepID=A0A0F9R941_9ZZZZ
MVEDGLILEGEQLYYAHTLSDRFKELFLLPMSDLHYGNPLSSKKHFLNTVQSIKEHPNYTTVINGDMCESTIKTSKGEIFRQVGSPQDQRDWIIETLYPIRKKILGMTIGNHEMRIYNEVGIDICKDIAAALNVPYRASGMLLKISFGSGNERHADRQYTYWVYFTHGYGGARTKSAKAVKVERVATWLHADVYIMSHDHVVNAAPDVYLLPDPRTRAEKDKKGDETGFTIGKLAEHRKMLVKTNAYLKWGGYAELGGFPPSDLTTPLIKFSPKDKPQIRVEV